MIIVPLFQFSRKDNKTKQQKKPWEYPWMMTCLQLPGSIEAKNFTAPKATQEKREDGIDVICEFMTG